jgi:circadian clock protein KaiC
MHLAVLHKMINQFKPQVFVMDPITTFISEGNQLEVKAMLMRLVDFLKLHQITAIFTSLTSGTNGTLEQTNIGISSLMDTWLLLRDIEINGERNRGLSVLKSRGMAHSNQIREFLLTNHGIELIDVYLGPEGVLTGTARQAQEAQARAAAVLRQEKSEKRRLSLEIKRKDLEARIAELTAEFENEKQEIEKNLLQDDRSEQVLVKQRKIMAQLRKADVLPNSRRRTP